MVALLCHIFATHLDIYYSDSLIEFCYFAFADVELHLDEMKDTIALLE